MARQISALAAIFVLSGCVNDPQDPDKQSSPFEILDPTAYDPLEHNVSIYFSSLDDASTQLPKLAKAYAQHRDNAMRGALILDVPLVGLAITGVVAAANHFAATTTLGMTAAGGGLLGARSYLGPSTKWAAYQSAEIGMECLAQAATDLKGVDSLLAQAIADQLNKTRKSPPKGTSQSDLDNAAKAYLDLNIALYASADAHAANQLTSAAQAIIQNTTKRALTGLQDINALTQAIQKTGAPSGGAAAAPAAPKALQAPAPTPDLSGMSLSTLTNAATNMTTTINGDLSEIKACIMSSSS